MSELYALTVRHLRSTLRGRAARAGAVIFVLGLGAALLLPDGTRGGLVLLAGLLVLVLFVSGFAVGAGAALPEDRVAGREAWLAALAPPAWKRRLAVVLAGWLLAVGMGLAGGIVVGALASVVRPDLTLRAHRAVPMPAGAVLAVGKPAVTLDLQPDADHADLEIDVRPLYRLADGMPVDRVAIAWQAGGDSGVLQASARGPLRLRPGPAARSVRLELQTQRVRLRLGDARRLGGTRAPLLAIAWTGLLLGLLAGAVAPVAVLFSRATTVQTAAAAAFVLLLFGATKHVLITLASDLQPEGWLSIAPGLLRASAWIAPDVPLLHLIAEAGALRAPGLGAAGLLLPALLYTVLASVPACVPAPRALATGVNT